MNHDFQVTTGNVFHRLYGCIGDRAGVMTARPYCLCHSFTTEYLRNGGKMLALQELLVHPGSKMVRHYAKYAEADIALDHAVASGGSVAVVEARDCEDKHLRPEPRGILFTAFCRLRPYFLPSHVLIKADTQIEIDLVA